MNRRTFHFKPGAGHFVIMQEKRSAEIENFADVEKNFISRRRRREESQIFGLSGAKFENASE